MIPIIKKDTVDGLYLGVNCEFDFVLLTQSVRDVHKQACVRCKVHACCSLLLE